VTSPADVHAAIIAAIRQRLALAEAATPGPWAIWRDLDHQGFYTVGDAAGVIPDGATITEGECNPTAHVYIEPDAALIAANDPAWTVRMCRAALERMERHRPQSPDVWPSGKPRPTACLQCMEDHPCPDVRAEAGVWDVEVDCDG
jgi:hypothetical protein